MSGFYFPGTIESITVSAMSVSNLPNASHVDGWELYSQSRQSNDLENCYLSLPSLALGISRIGQLVSTVSG